MRIHSFLMGVKIFCSGDMVLVPLREAQKTRMSKTRPMATTIREANKSTVYIYNEESNMMLEL